MDEPATDAILAFSQSELARLRAEQEAVLNALEDHRDIEALENELIN